jgi:hypothetical protein
VYPVPSRCAFAFAGELSARHSRCWRFRGLRVHHCYDLLSCSPPLQETFTSGLSTVRSPSPLPDITTVATGQFPPAGLTPAGQTTSVAAQLPPPHPHRNDVLCTLRRSQAADLTQSFGTVTLKVSCISGQFNAPPIACANEFLLCGMKGNVHGHMAADHTPIWAAGRSGAKQPDANGARACTSRCMRQHR